MVSASNNVKCSNCQTLNSSTADKCNFCGHKLRGGVPHLVLGVAVLAALGVGCFIFKDKLPSGVTSSSNVLNNPSPITTKSPTGDSSIPGANATIYHSFGEVPNIPKGTFNYGGSTTFAPLRSPNVVAAINKAHPEFQLRYTQPLTGKPGSGKGIEMLVEGQLSFAQSSRAVKDEEFAKAKNRGFTLEQVPVAIDGIAFYVNPKLMNRGVKQLTLAQVRDIFTGKINNWKDVGGPDLKILPFSRNLQAGGTVDFFYENVLEKQRLAANVQEVANTTDSIRKVALAPGGIGYASTSEAINQRMIRPLLLAKEAGLPFVLPCASETCTNVNKTAFANSSYPLTRRLFVLIKRDGRLDEQAGVAYANMLLSDEGQKFVEQAGFVPVR